MEDYILLLIPWVYLSEYVCHMQIFLEPTPVPSHYRKVLQYCTKFTVKIFQLDPKFRLHAKSTEENCVPSPNIAIHASGFGLSTIIRTTR